VFHHGTKFDFVVEESCHNNLLFTFFFTIQMSWIIEYVDRKKTPRKFLPSFERLKKLTNSILFLQTVTQNSKFPP